MNPILNLWLIPILPLAGAAINGFLGKRSSRRAVTTIALFFSGAAFVDGSVSCIPLLVVDDFPAHEIPWH